MICQPSEDASLLIHSIWDFSLKHINNFLHVWTVYFSLKLSLGLNEMPLKQYFPSENEMLNVCTIN